jgi:ribosomal protein S18 acetylase RimI-like enzyme
VLGLEDVGHRVVVRWIAHIRDNRPIYSDVLGELTDATETHLTVRTADGPVHIARTDVAASKRIPDRRARTATERLELIAARGWPAPETTHLGDWLLRAADGWTSRGNSALPIGDPGRSLSAAIDAVIDWYVERGLPPAISVPLPIGGRLMAELDRRGWDVPPLTIVQTAPLACFAAEDPGVRVESRPSTQWLAAVGKNKGGLPAAARHILTAPDQVCFASGYGESGELVAIGRGVVTDGWLGLSVVAVAPPARRQGWARRICRALGVAGGRLGATQTYLLVEARNEPAVALYESLGFTTAHGYYTRRAPAA